MTPRGIKALVAALVLGLGLQALVWYWLRHFCMPYEVHTFKWQCELNIPFLGLSFIIAGALFGWITDRAAWLGGISVGVLLVGVGALTRLLSPWYGTDLSAAAVYAIFFGIIPCTLGSVGAFTLHHKRDAVAL
jgi:hypothetical protein